MRASPPRPVLLQSRAGAVLLVVLVLLSLFAAVGISFVYYASAHGTAARAARDAQTQTCPDVEPELLLDYFLGQLLYDVPDDASGVYSALRGHSLGRNLYGGADGPGANLVPFNGVGRLRTPGPFGTLVPGTLLEDAQLLNYTYHPDDAQLAPAQRFLRDPERPGWRANLTTPASAYTVGFNAPYTYPDLNSAFLAAVRADGAVLLASFHRPWAAAVAGAPPGAGEFHDPSTGALHPWWSPVATPPPWFKYTTLRPLPALHPGFPPPEDGGGDVQNLVGGPGTFRRYNPRTGLPEYWNNDSCWIDAGFPVMTSPDGRKYKPLFAALITDLDNRINLNVHGNLRGPSGGHASNQGWGPWEVNLGRVLTRGGGQEWRNLLHGTARPPLPGRYGGRPWARQFGTPGLPGQSALPPLLTHAYGQVDLDGVNEWTGTPSGRLLLPGFGAPPDSAFPSYHTPVGTYAGYGNGSAVERLGHPLLYDVFWPAGDNRRFPVQEMEALLRYGDMGSPALTADLFRLCPGNFADARLRRLVTTDSADLDRPGVPPWIHHPSGFPYTMAPTTDPDQPALPQGPAIPFPATALNRGPAPFGARLNNGEFNGVDWRSVSAALGRVNLSRPLPPYPHQGSGTAPPFGPPLVALDMPFNVDAPTGPIWKQFLVAQEARQRLANDIYRRLLAVTGVPPLRPEQHPQAPPAEFLRVRRWLAQLAANLVDYLDEDDISTPFCFYTAEDYRHLPFPPPLPPDPGRIDPTRATEGSAGEIQWPLYWVFGTELPQLVVNEALAEVTMNDPDEAYSSAVRVFVELHNPLPRLIPPGTDARDALPVPLSMGWGGAGYAPYRVVVGVKSVVPGHPAGAAVLPGLENSNVLGNPELAAVRTLTSDADFLAAGPQPGVLPSGFLLLGAPQAARGPFAALDPFAGANAATIPAATPVLRTASLQYQRGFRIVQRSDPPDERTAGVAVLLRRLANPGLPFDGRRSLGGLPNPAYNPYVTIDYLENIPLQPVARGVRLPLASTGRLQPYAAHRALLQPQLLRAGPRLNHSFGRGNVPAPAAYDWLTHLDRAAISPPELLHVSGYQPYQLTQRFISPDPTGRLTKFNHRAPWTDDTLSGGGSHRLYRLFEFLQTGPRATGVASGGRVAGKVNVNTVWDIETLQALCDAQPSVYFGDADVQQAFRSLLYDPQTVPTPNPLRRTQGVGPGPDDRPFWGLGLGAYPPGDVQFPSGGSDDTPLRLLRMPPPAAPPHPYLQQQLLSKLSGQLTTRSNVFAVWLTVGFFEVTDETTRPVKLGAEIGRAENRHVRHRMFAILDRTNLSIASCVTALAQPVMPPLPFTPGQPQTVLVGALSGTTALPVTGPGLNWRIAAGTTLVVDTGSDQEVVRVQAVNRFMRPPTLTAVFTRRHAAGAPISLGHSPGAAPIFLKPLAVAQPGPLPFWPYLPQPPYALGVTVRVDPARSNAAALGGRYDGLDWVIQPGATLLVDVGPDQEAVTVRGPFTVDARTGTGTFTIIVTRPHAEEFLITNTLLGNPGPQPAFSARNPVFSAIVRHRSVIR